MPDDEQPAVTQPVLPAWFRYLRNDTARHERDIPKRRRQRRVVAPARPMLDPHGTLGHAPRPRRTGSR